MAKRKDQELKDFLISARKRKSPKLTDAPIWAIQRAGKRMFNQTRQRNWRETHLARPYHNQQKKKKKCKKK
ncbi:hypothetical protein KKE06_05335 [Candidatus Micrarchaeota archaeon]|nr:hypothetical protein [Candidatus Micrarchaeota archaeon]MBU1929922.1 hypothetical protein [Candidatus Micrarchaeota archaeon]